MDFGIELAHALGEDLRNCNKCGHRVLPQDDAVLLDVALGGDPMLVFALSRHTKPFINEDGEQVCEGSPSRAQYLEGMPRDSRGLYPYNLQREAEVRRAYASLQEMFGASAS